MRFCALLSLAAASVVTAAPVESVPVSDASVNETMLAERGTDGYSCGIQNYAQVTENRVAKALWYFWGKQRYNGNLAPSVIYADAGQTAMVACFGHTGVWLTVDAGVKPSRYPFDPVVLGRNIDMTVKSCGNTANPLASDESRNGAFQFWGDGYNILVTGNGECS